MEEKQWKLLTEDYVMCRVAHIMNSVRTFDQLRSNSQVTRGTRKNKSKMQVS